MTMSFNDSVKQKSDFRQQEVEQLFAWIAAGESASVVGVSGTGKSNLFNHLLDPHTKERYLREDAANTIIIRVNFHYMPDFSSRSAYSLILEQLEMLQDQYGDSLEIPANWYKDVFNYHETMLSAGEDALLVQRYFKLAFRGLMANSNRRLVFLFDQFDDVYREADAKLFANLRGMRETYKYRLSYLLFTRDALPGLAESDPAREEFYELVASNEMGLHPYNERDSARLIERVCDRNHLTLSAAVQAQLFQLCGGHAGFLRAALLTVARDGVTLPAETEAAAATLLQRPSVMLECEKLWTSLPATEQRALAYYAHDMVQEDADAAEHVLQLKGLLLADGAERPLKIFCPLFAYYVQNQEPLWDRMLHFDKTARQVWVMGRPSPILTPLEFRLFSLLNERDGELTLKDELVDAGWPHAKGGVSDEALIAAIARLRKKIEPNPKEPQFIETVHNQGYLLKQGQ